MTTNRSLVPLPASRLPARARPSLPARVVQRALPVAGRTVAMAAVGFAAEYALRSVANRALASLAAPSRPPAGPTRTRVVVTELVVIRRMRRL